jgi:hypothetical protein
VGVEVQRVNARDVKNVPGCPKTDKLDAVWLAKLTEEGMLRPSVVLPVPVRQLRDYTRLRVDLTPRRVRPLLAADGEVARRRVIDVVGDDGAAAFVYGLQAALVTPIGPVSARFILAEIGMDMTRDGGTLFGFDDTGQLWVMQQVKARAEGPPIPG